MNNYGNNLIFLISQPRSGSTMVQRIIGGHSSVHTQSEPWILLHPLHALKPENLASSYDSHLYSRTLRIFIKSLPGGFSEYRKAIGSAYCNLYDSILKRESKNLFLDKTPRYYHIIDEIELYFPKARFIFLIRNPAAVFTSIQNTWVKDELDLLALYKDDLLLAPSLILKGIEKLGTKAIAIRYENIIENPENQFKEICSFLNIPYEQQMIDYGEQSLPQWRYGDKKTVYESKSPNQIYKDEWKKHLKNPQLVYLTKQYIEYLGDDILKRLGYSYLETMSLLEENMHEQDNSIPSMDLMELLNEEHSFKLEYSKLKTLFETQSRQIINYENELAESIIIRNDEVAKLNTMISEYHELLDKKNKELISANEKLAATESSLLEKTQQFHKENKKI